MPYKSIEDKKSYNRYYRTAHRTAHKERLSLANRKWKLDNKERHKFSRKMYLNNNREIINKKAREKYHNNSIARNKRLIRRATINKYGKLKQGFVYHHNTEPYNIDKFQILEHDFHEYYSKNKDRLISNKKLYGVYQHA